ncbi:Eco57I restriction-modification methylase domain-containing protein [Leptospira brenneri]|uniref:Eco57I restriction-modification methylase domain-containing protein n=1 Tax=Leptospira brenneri TaxID=2023182 RepID=UPI000C2AA840|nr:TaqI-like C-terminal specificity domain-containing protein [Leptospira brenneri]PJZ46164.1 hypothetical protein CH361_03395 [Leptospira brenneri]
MYLVNDKGERKASGSYYTPDYIVETIVKFTLGPLIDDIEKEDLSIKEKIAKTLTLRILDPAMGSGHFLVEVISYVNDRIEALIQNELEEYTNKPGRKSKAQADLEALLKEAENGLYKRILAKKCIYGVDKNPMAVELAKLSIWIYTLQRNRKLEFFDYNLRCGDSLIGSQEKTFSSQLDSKSKERMLFGDNDELYKNVVEDFKEEFKKYFDLESVEERMKYYESVIKPNQQKLKYLANIELAIAFAEKTDEIHSIYDAHKNKLLQKIRIEKSNEYLKKLATGNDLEAWEIKLFQVAKKVHKDYNPIHWELDFPNVFIDKGGFDGVVGNPPYVFSRENIEQKEKIYFTKKYSTYEYQSDLYILFVEKSLYCKHEKGRVGMIIPNSWLGNVKATKIRKMILNESSISYLVYCLKETFDVNVETVVISMHYFKANNKIKVLEFKNPSKMTEIGTYNQNLFDLSGNQRLNLRHFSSNAIIKKMENVSVSLETFFDITRGVNAYDKYRGQSDDIIKNRAYHSEKNTDNSFSPELKGKHVGRYFYNWDGDTWIKYGDWLAAPREPKYFTGVRIVLRQIPGERLLSTLITEKFIIDQTVFIAKPKEDCKLNLSFIVSLINSTLMSFYFKSKNDETDEIFPKVKIENLKSFPIPVLEISNVIQKFEYDKLIQLADIMLSQHKEIQEIQKKFTKILQSDLKIAKLSDKLEDWYKLTFEEFIGELKKKKIELKLDQKAEWMDYFEKEKSKANAIQEIISKTDSDIDLMVYKLYGLTEEEIRIVEGAF